MVAANEKGLWCNACTIEKDFKNPTGHCTGKAKSKLKSRAKQLASSGSSDSPVSSPVSKRRNNQISPRKRSSRQKRPAADSSESCGAESGGHRCRRIVAAGVMFAVGKTLMRSRFVATYSCGVAMM